MEHENFTLLKGRRLLDWCKSHRTPHRAHMSAHHSSCQRMGSGSLHYCCVSLIERSMVQPTTFLHGGLALQNRTQDSIMNCRRLLRLVQLTPHLHREDTSAYRFISQAHGLRQLSVLSRQLDDGMCVQWTLPSQMGPFHIGLS